MEYIANVEDTIEVSTEAPLVVNIGSPRTTVRTKPELGLTQVSLSDAYQVVPFAKRITMDFSIPESITQGLFVDIDELNAALLKEVADREIAIIETETYAKDYADGVEQQVYTNIDATFIQDATGDAYAKKVELTTLILDYDTGTGTTQATLQDIYSSGVSSANSLAVYDTDLQAIAADTTALATRTTSLEVQVDGVDGINARLDTIEGVAAGVFQVWYGAPQELLIGMVKFTDDLGVLRTTELSILPTDIQWQYLGGTLGENSDGWVRTDSSASTEATTAQITADSKSVTYTQTTAPIGLTANDAGDRWIDDNKVEQVRNGIAWDYVTNATADQAYGWAGGASKLVTGPNGEVTGWSFADGSNVESTFSINAENFYVQNTLNDITNRPFSISGNDILFNGKVTFANVTDTTDIVLATDSISRLTNDLGFTNDDAASVALVAAQAAQDTADGAIRTYYQATAPTGLNATSDVGDMWYDTDDGQAYRWSGTVWNIIEDNSIAVALAAAVGAQATADGKITSFIQPTEPTPEGIGDIWIDSDDFNKTYIWSGIAWAYTRDTSTDSDIAQALADAATAQGTADGKIDSFYQDTAPVTASEGDLWFDTSDGNKIYTYRALVWTETQDSAIGTALADAATAQSTADGKITTFYQTTAPTPEGVGDLWVDIDDFNKAYRWNGSSWDYMRDTSKDSDIAQGISDAANAQASADGKITSFFQITAPTNASEGDIWFDTDDGNKIYSYISNIWTVTQDSAIGQAISDAATAQSTADGKITTYYQTVTPTASAIGDLWVDIDDLNKAYRWNGTTWDYLRDTTKDVAIDNAQADATAAIGDAAIANELLSDIASDSKLTPDEKQSTQKEWGAIVTEKVKIDAQADTFSVSKVAYSAAYNALDTYLTLLLSNLSTTSDIIGTTFRSTFNTYYDAKVDILNTISAAAKLLADTAQTTADSKTTTFYQAIAPTAYSIGDVWVDTSTADNLIYVWNGTIWDPTGASANPQDVVDAINAAETTTIHGARLTTGTALASSIGTEVIYDSTHWVGGVEQAANVYKMKIDLGNGEIHIK